MGLGDWTVDSWVFYTARYRRRLFSTSLSEICRAVALPADRGLPSAALLSWFERQPRCQQAQATALPWRSHHRLAAAVSVRQLRPSAPSARLGAAPPLPMLRFLLNVLWFVLGGVLMGLGWWLAGLLAALTIVGIPWARACFVIGSFSFWPFGYEAVSRRALTGRMDFGTGPLGMIGNVIWFLLAGWWLAIGHLTSALACFVTIIGIPFGIQHIKLALTIGAAHHFHLLKTKCFPRMDALN